MLDAIGAIGVPVCRGALPDDPPGDPHGVISVEGGEMFVGSLEKLAEFDAGGAAAARRAHVEP